MSIEWYGSKSQNFKAVNFSELEGKTLKEIRIDNDEDTVKFITDCGKTYIMGHVQD